MRRRLGLVVAALSLWSVAALAEKVKLDVTVIENVPSTTTYSWQTPGRGSVSCSGNSCSSYFRPATAGTSQVFGATLKLLLPDGRIAIARCVANMGNAAFALVGAMTGDDHLNDPRDCGVPPGGEAIQAEFNGQIIKLSWHLPSIDGNGHKSGETYYLIGVLNPSSSSSAGTTISQPAQSVPSASAPSPNPAPIQAQAPLAEDSTSGSKLQQVDAMIRPLANEYRSLHDQSDLLKKQCPSPITERGCLERARDFFVARKKVEESLVHLLDERMSILNATSLNASTQKEKDSTIQSRDQWTSALAISEQFIEKADRTLSEDQHTNSQH